MEEPDYKAELRRRKMQRKLELEQQFADEELKEKKKQGRPKKNLEEEIKKEKEVEDFFG